MTYRVVNVHGFALDEHEDGTTSRPRLLCIEPAKGEPVELFEGDELDPSLVSPAVLAEWLAEGVVEDESAPEPESGATGGGEAAPAEGAAPDLAIDGTAINAQPSAVARSEFDGKGAGGA